MLTKFSRLGAVAGLVVFGAGMAGFAGGALPARADDGGDYAQILTDIQIEPPDAAMQPSSAMICKDETGLVQTRCAQSFTDKARFGKTDEVVIYVLSQPNQASKLQAMLDAKMRKFGDVLSVDESFKIENKAENRVVDVPENCEQAANNGTYSCAVCFASYGQLVAVTSVVFPSAGADGIDTEHPADIDRADALDENAVEGLDDLVKGQ